MVVTGGFGFCGTEGDGGVGHRGGGIWGNGRDRVLVWRDVKSETEEIM